MISTTRSPVIVIRLTALWTLAILGFCLASFGPYGFTIAFWTIVGGVIALLVNRSLSSLMIVLGVLVCLIVNAPGHGHYWWQHDQQSCGLKLRDITYALQDYESKHGHFPPALLADTDGRPMHSWRVLILPHLRRQEPRAGSKSETYSDVYTQYRFDEAWDSPHNASLARLVDAYQCPAQIRSKTGSPTATPYLAVVGENAFWQGSTPRKPDDVRDGMSRSACLIETTPIDNWMEPKDISYDHAIDYLASDASMHQATQTSSSWARLLPRHVQMADSRTALAPLRQPREVIAAVLNVADGKPDPDAESVFIEPKRIDPMIQFVAFLALALIPGFVPFFRWIVTWRPRGTPVSHGS